MGRIVHFFLIPLCLFPSTEESCDFDTAWPYQDGVPCSAWSLPPATDGKAGFVRTHNMAALPNDGDINDASHNLAGGAALGLGKGKEHFCCHGYRVCT